MRSFTDLRLPPSSVRAVDLARRPLARQRREAVDRSGSLIPSALRAAEYGLRERVLAAALKRRGKAQKLVLRLPHQPGSCPSSPVLPRGDGAGLVEHNDLDACRSASSETAVLNRMPCFAPMPLPTIIATGVASPSAQGQLITSTDMPRASAKPTLLPEQQPHDECDGRNGYDRRDEHAGDLIGDLCDGRLGRGRVADHLDDLRKGRILADAQSRGSG